MEHYDELERMKVRQKREKAQKSSGQRKKAHPSSSRNDDAFDVIDLENFDYTSMRNRSSSSKTQTKKLKKRPGKKKRKKKWSLMAKALILTILIFFAVVFVKDKITGRYWTVAVFGVDSRDGNLEKGLSDVEMICTIDKKTGEIKLVSVYRDTYLQTDRDGNYHKINAAYSKGGHEQAIDALERNLDLKIDNYATFNWKAVADAINILGGIDLEISESEFKYINGFITETVESTGVGSVHLKAPGMNHLDGVQAVAYARLRLMDTDYNRTARQRKVVSLAMEKAKQADFSVLNNILVTVLPQISTDIGLSDLLPMASSINKYYIGSTDGFPFSRGEAKVGKSSCVIPLTLESNVVQLHQLLYGVENYEPSSTVKKISSHIAEVSGMGEVAENAPKATVGGSGGNENSGGNNQPSESHPANTAPEPETQPDVTETLPEETTAEEIDVPEESSQTKPTIEEIKPEETTKAKEPTVSTKEEIGPGVGLPAENSSNSGNSGIIGPGSDLAETKPVKPQPKPSEETSLEDSSEDLIGPGI